MRDYASMTQDHNDYELDEEFRQWVRDQLDLKGTGAKKGLAEAVGKGQDWTTRLIKRPEEMKTHRDRLKEIPMHLIPSIEAFFGSKSPVRTTRMVPVVGYVGASADGAVLFATGDGNFGEEPAPIGAAPHVEALEVRGDSMYGTIQDGWILFYEDKETPAPWHMKNLCVCWLEDDRVLVKIPIRSSAPGLFDLYSANAPLMEDVPVRYFSVVTDIKTRVAAQRYARDSNSHIDELRGDKLVADQRKKLELLAQITDMPDADFNEVMAEIEKIRRADKNELAEKFGNGEADRSSGEGYDERQQRGNKAG